MSRSRNWVWKTYAAAVPFLRKVRLHRLIRIGSQSLGGWVTYLVLCLTVPRKGLITTDLGFKIYWDMRDDLIDMLFTQGAWEPGTTSLFQRLLRPGMAVIDVGAHIGYYTLLSCALVGPKGKVYAFEPEERNYNLLIKNIELNDFQNAVPVRQAVSNTTGLARLFLNNDAIRYSLFPRKRKRSKTGIVETTTLDDFLAGCGWPRIDLVKIDAEGAELAALEGMIGLMERNHDLKLVIELAPKNLAQAGTTSAKLLEKLDSAGYSIQLVVDETKSLHPCRRDELLVLAARRNFVNLFCQRTSWTEKARYGK